MSSKKDDTQATDDKVGGLPKDPGLGGFKAAAAGAFGTSTRTAPRPDEAEKPAPANAPAERGLHAVPPATDVVVRRAPSVPTAVQSVMAVDLDAGDVEIRIEVPNLGDEGAKLTQCLVNIESPVRDRFASYQTTTKQATGQEPNNAVVVRRAFLHARKDDKFADLLAAVKNRSRLAEDVDDDPDGLLGPAEGRRSARGRMKNSVQQSFRPTRQELATYDAFWQGYGFPSRSDFLNALLDLFLPELPSQPRARRAGTSAAVAKATQSASKDTADQPAESATAQEDSSN
ncbi:hypothetical protein [Nocardia yamanashiensis]|uniref:hypothetical protein n=1 Tax=Nocardia yamanashiensis TaxID=209247 RepID=UPI00082BCBAA|nr:hypothetical protein [Nocardia yamanashiensis]